MKAFTASLATFGLATSSAALELSTLPPLTSQNSMSVLRQMKQSLRETSRANGAFAEGRYTSMSATACTNGQIGEYSCSNVDLTASLTHGDMGSSTAEGNDIWGESLHSCNKGKQRLTQDRMDIR
jgi:hypothetical protein